MSAITLEQAQAQLQAYLDAELAVLSGQSYSIAGRSLTRANLADIQNGVKTWSSKVQELQNSVGGRGRARTVSPL